jgi:acetyltransferase
VGGVFIVSGGFKESGEVGGKLQAQLAGICRESGLRLLGPNTSGYINPYASCVASFVPGVEKLQKGRVAVVAQSGGINLSLAFLLASLGEGVSLSVGLGNGVDVAAADVLEVLADDPNTSAIALALEGVPNGRWLFDVVRKVTPHKPIVAVVAGRAYVGELVVSHTGNLMGLHERTVAALTQAGAVVMNSTEAVAQAAATLASRRLPPKRHVGIGVVIGQAGPGLLIMDGIRQAGIEVPELHAETIRSIQELLPPLTYVKNPVDTGRPAATYPQVVQAVAEDDRVDAILAWALGERLVLDSALDLVGPAVRKTGKPLVFGTLGMKEDLRPALDSLKAENIPAVLSPERVVIAGVALAADAKARWRVLQSESPEASVQPRSRLQGPFDESRSKTLLEQYGIQSPRRVLCTTRGQAQSAFITLQKPVVVKIAAPDVAHKTEAGGVYLNVNTQTQLESALDALSRIPTSHPGQALLEEMAPEGVELIVGGIRDDSWGPCVVVGLGGVLTEAIADTAVRLAPVSELDVAEMLESLRGRKLLDGFRNLPACDREAIHKAVVGISRLLIEHPEVKEVEINPLRVNAAGALALDALVVLDSATSAPRAQSLKPDGRQKVQSCAIV